MLLSDALSSEFGPDCESDSVEVLSDSESVDSDSDDEVSVDELSLLVDSLDEPSVKSGNELLEDSVDVGAGESSVKASAAPPLNSPASTTAKTAKCFFTAVSSSLVGWGADNAASQPVQRQVRPSRYSVLAGHDTSNDITPPTQGAESVPGEDVRLLLLVGEQAMREDAEADGDRGPHHRLDGE